MFLEVTEKETGIGRIVLVFRDRRLCRIEFDSPRREWQAALRRRFGRVELRDGRGEPEIVDRIEAYFAGHLAAIDPIPVDTGGTGFQQQVWRELRRIPAGTTVSYGDLARSVGRPAAVRAAGRANGANPVPIVIPCHRVVAADGRLHGYGGGLDRKRRLLCHEGVTVDAAGRTKPVEGTEGPFPPERVTPAHPGT